MFRIACFAACVAISVFAASGKEPLNVLFITVDDMNADSIGVFGCAVEGTSPHVDRLAAEGMRFEHAHVQVANCRPSRNVMQSGLYPHNNGVEGFYEVRNHEYPILPDLFKDNGYFVGILGKVTHTTPMIDYPWDAKLSSKKHLGKGNKDAFYEAVKDGITEADAAGKPFYLVINISDPHTPFYGMGKGNAFVDDPIKPTKVFSVDEVEVPGFLPDSPLIRKELAHYYSSVRRADDCAGATLKALKDSGKEAETVVVFLSDHGMPFPFGKTTVYQHGTRTPWIVKWPGVVQPGSVDTEHMISTVDFAPTILEIVGIPNPGGMDGRSFAPILKGEKQARRDHVFKEYNENSSGGRHPMRSVQTREFCYVFNPWSDGENRFMTATTGSLSYAEMKRLAETDERVAERLELFDHRVVEELFDVRQDPDALVNLAWNPEYKEVLESLRSELEEWMIATGDHMLPVFQQREDPLVAAAYMARVQAESDERKKAGLVKPWQNKPKKKKGP